MIKEIKMSKVSTCWRDRNVFQALALEISRYERLESSVPLKIKADKYTWWCGG